MSFVSSSAVAPTSCPKKWTILGQDPDVLRAMWANIVSWFVSKYMPSYLPRLLPPCDYETKGDSRGGSGSTTATNNETRCISIGRPGGLEQLRVVTLQPNMVTKGYNVGTDGSPFYNRNQLEDDEMSGLVIVQNEAFSVNYADCCIRWGLYESAKQFVGWPIVPGFDVAGTVQSGSGSSHSTAHHDFQPGDRVFGCTLFGAYSSRIAIPAMQLRKIPADLSFAQAASLPAVSLTALYALHLAGHYPPHASSSSQSSSSSSLRRTNRAILIHSAAGGVGSMAVQMAKILGLNPIVGVVGSAHKVESAKLLGCDYVIVSRKGKRGSNSGSSSSSTAGWHQAAAEIAPPGGYSAVLDASGVSTLQDSYGLLCPTGRLIVFGFHSNLPLGQAALNPWEWLRMGLKMASMPAFDAMDLVVRNKAVLGFNLSFFASETELVSVLFDQVCEWLQEKKLTCPRVAELKGMEAIGQAHEQIMSGQSIGKIVITTTCD